MAFTKAAVMMEDAKKSPEDKTSFEQALRFNHLFWTILQADITDANNKLPNPIKANIMSLSIFVDKQTSKALRSGDPADLDIMISINRNLALGLRQTPDSATDSATDSGPEVAPAPQRTSGETFV
ncbi:flagellar biosynthesis regulator FlaF [uncultured Rhodospira sp.]|uniref:flagellar biosynthesis regulator FlaF n=1 Tax=uncultured Rhodospira sp. TaxID=1936189 RepID=UPI002638C253|nr:flagellar biosynthesis regulator FlaF [uncultured Rhodospira sp.]